MIERTTKSTPPSWLVVIVALTVGVLAWLVYTPTAKGDTICTTTCTTDGWGRPVCKTVCQEV